MRIANSGVLLLALALGLTGCSSEKSTTNQTTSTGSSASSASSTVLPSSEAGSTTSSSSSSAPSSAASGTEFVSKGKKFSLTIEGGKKSVTDPSAELAVRSVDKGSWHIAIEKPTNGKTVDAALAEVCSQKGADTMAKSAGAASTKVALRKDVTLDLGRLQVPGCRFDMTSAEESASIWVGKLSSGGTDYVSMISGAGTPSEADAKKDKILAGFKVLG